MKQVCTQCGREFELTDREIDFYEKNGLNLPTRCKECRQVNKEQASKAQQSGHTAVNSSEAALLKARGGEQGLDEDMEEGLGPAPGWTRRKLITTFVLMVVVLIVCFGGTYLFLKLQ